MAFGHATKTVIVGNQMMIDKNFPIRGNKFFIISKNSPKFEYWEFVSAIYALPWSLRIFYMPQDKNHRNSEKSKRSLATQLPPFPRKLLSARIHKASAVALCPAEVRVFLRRRNLAKNWNIDREWAALSTGRLAAINRQLFLCHTVS